jgi:TrfB plasmid transcriptional repressor
MRKNRRISELEFARVQASATRMHPESFAVARAVLVHGKTQAQVHRETGKSRQNISLILTTFWSHFERLHLLPEGWRTESVSLPEKDWPAVRKIELKAKAELAKKATAAG